MTAVQPSPTSTSTGTSRSAWRYAARLWVVVVCFIGVGVVRSIDVGIPFRDPQGEYLSHRLLYTVGIFIGLVLVDAFVRTARPRKVRRVWSTVRARWTPARLALAWAALLAYHLTYLTYHTL